MSDTVRTMLEDDRKIQGVYYSDSGLHEIGIMGCTRIEAYGEPGPYCHLPFIAVWYEGELKHRIPAGMVQVVYESADTEAKPK